MIPKDTPPGVSFLRDAFLRNEMRTACVMQALPVMHAFGAPPSLHQISPKYRKPLSSRVERSEIEGSSHHRNAKILRRAASQLAQDDKGFKKLSKGVKW